MKIKLDHIEKKYGNFSLNINTEFESGSFTSILGPSGCGKTTILQIIAGIVEPDLGCIYFSDKNVTKTPVHQRNIGMVFQDYALFPHLTVKGNIEYPLKIKKIDKNKREDRLSELLSSIKLQSFSGRKPLELSGGEKQRVALARSVAAMPDVLLLDEPLSALDASLRLELKKDIKTFQQKYNLTAVYVTHDQTEAFSLSDYIILVIDGAIIQYDTPEQLYHYPKTKEAADFLGYRNKISCSSLIINNSTGKEKLSGRAVIDEHTFLDVTVLEKSSSNEYILFFRPEAVEISTIQKANTITGTVQFCEYLGESYNYEVATSFGTVQLTVKTEKQKKIGENIEFYIPSSRILAYPANY